MNGGTGKLLKHEGGGRFERGNGFEGKGDERKEKARHSGSDEYLNFKAETRCWEFVVPPSLCYRG